MPRDYYDVLGVKRGADIGEIKSSFRRLARQYHPDVNPAADAEEKFKLLSEAYAVLSDEEKRARYDRFGHAGVEGMSGSSYANGFSGLEDIFEDLLHNFGGFQRPRSGRGPAPGNDRRLDITIEFEEAVFGAEITRDFERLESCVKCAGSGAAAGSKPIRCQECGGRGELRQVQNTFLGSMVRVIPCRSCQGKGERISNPCTQCRGAGRRNQRVSKTFSIPGGVHSGTKIQYRGDGDIGGAGAPRGNLYLVVNVNPHPFYKREDNDIILDIPINVAQAALGAQIRVPVVGGKEHEIHIPAGTQTGKSFRLRGYGFPRLRNDGTSSGRGDQIVYVQVAVPAQLDERQRELFRELAKSLGTEVQPIQNGRGFFDRMKEFITGEGS